MAEEIVAIFEVGSINHLPDIVRSKTQPFESSLRSFIERAVPAKELASQLGLPGALSVRYEVVSREGELTTNGKIPLRLSVHGSTGAMEIMSSHLEAEIGDLLLEKLDRSAVNQIMAGLGIPQSQGCSFELLVTDAPPPEIS
jgi:hypothetical protein